MTRLESAPMSPDPGRLAELAVLREVRIAEVPFALLLVAHHESGTAGVLRARRGPVDKRVVLEGGVPVDCRSNLLHETLSRYLVTLGRIDEATANQCLAESAWRGTLIGEVLIQKGLIDAQELTRVLQQNLAKKLLDLFTWPDGEVVREEAQSATASALKVRVPQLVLTGVTRFMPQAAIDRAVAPVAGALLAANPHRAGLLEELRLAPPEASLLAALERPQRIEELLAAGGRSTPELARSLCALLVLGLAVPEERLAAWAAQPARRAPAPMAAAASAMAPAGATVAPAAAPVAAVAAPGAVAAPPVATAAPAAVAAPAVATVVTPAVPLRPQPRAAAPGLAPERVTELLNRVSQLFLDHRQKDAFDLLGVAEDAPAAAVEQAYLDFARELAPARFEEPGLRMVADYARDLFLAGARAYAELADKERRSELTVRRQVQREERERAARAAYHRIDTDLLDPALQFRKGMALAAAGKLKPALQQLEFAADCDPQNGTYRAEVARCRFRLSPGSAGRQALEELEEAQRVDPKSVEAFLYFGEIARELGRFDDAEASLRRAARLLGPGDRRALDALHELAVARKKKR